MIVCGSGALSVDEAKAVRSVWQGLDLPGLIDVHTHFMPKPVMDKVWAYFDSAGPLIGREWPITYRADERPEDRDPAGLRGPGVHVDDLSPQAGHGRLAQQLVRRFLRAHPRMPAHGHVLSGGVGAEVCCRGHRIRCGSVQVAYPGGRLQSHRPTTRRCLGHHCGRRRTGGDPLRVRTGTGNSHRSWSLSPHCCNAFRGCL